MCHTLICVNENTAIKPAMSLNNLQDNLLQPKNQPSWHGQLRTDVTAFVAWFYNDVTELMQETKYQNVSRKTQATLKFDALYASRLQVDMNTRCSMIEKQVQQLQEKVKLLDGRQVRQVQGASTDAKSAGFIDEGVPVEDAFKADWHHHFVLAPSAVLRDYGGAIGYFSTGVIEVGGLACGLVIARKFSAEIVSIVTVIVFSMVFSSFLSYSARQPEKYCGGTVWNM